MEENAGKIIIGAGIAVAVIAIVLIIQLTSVAIYADFFQKNEYRFTTYSPSTVYFQNNNFLSATGFNPLFIGSIKIVNATGIVDCFYDVTKDEPCDTVRIDLQKIESGQQAKLSFYVDPHGNNFTIIATPYLNLSNLPIELSHGHWYCKHTADEYYWCS